jgi:hypothetical protein
MVEVTQGPSAQRVIDLRGLRKRAQAPSVLADPTGRRARRLHVAGRILASLFLVWLCGLVLAGLGLLPVSDVPLAGALRAAEEPARLSASPSPLEPSDGGLLPAQPLSAFPDAIARTTGDAGRGSAARAAAGSTSAGAHSRAAARRARHRDATASQHHAVTGGGAGTPGANGAAASSGPAAHSSRGNATPHSSRSPAAAAHANGNGNGQGTATPPASSSGTTHGNSGQAHGSSSFAPGHTRTTIHGRPAG